MPVFLDNNMKFVIMQLEAHYLILIYKYITLHPIQKYLCNDLLYAIEYYIKKTTEIFTALQNNGSFAVPSQPLNPEKGEQIILFDLLANFCFTPSDETIDAYTIKPDQKDAKATFEKKEDLCKNLQWAIGHLVLMYQNALYELKQNENFIEIENNQSSSVKN